MTATEFADKFEQVATNKRFRIGAGALGALVLVVSLGLGLHQPRVRVALTAALPQQAYDIPILHSLPDPQPMMPRSASGRVMTEASRVLRSGQLLARRR